MSETEGYLVLRVGEVIDQGRCAFVLIEDGRVVWECPLTEHNHNMLNYESDVDPEHAYVPPKTEGK